MATRRGERRFDLGRPGAPVRPGLLCALAGALIDLGCFTGADALHLPCERDDDCGRGQSCLAVAGSDRKFCDGPPDSGSSGSDSTGSPMSESSTDDPTKADLGPVPGCGNNMLEPELGEECDVGADTIECNSSPTCTGDACCKAARCGDGYLNAGRFETCDPPSDEGPLAQRCSDACREPAFAYDFLQPASMRFVFIPGPASIPDWFEPLQDRWLIASGGGWTDDLNFERLSSGPYQPPPDQRRDGGVIYAITRDPIALPEIPPGTRYELRIKHAYGFDPTCGANGGPSDGGLAMILPSGGDELFPLVPIGATYQPIVPSGCGTIDCLDPPMNPPAQACLPNPLQGDAGFTAGAGTAEPLADMRFVIADEFVGNSIRIAFVLGYDCGNCWPGAPPLPVGWVIDDVVVGAFDISG